MVNFQSNHWALLDLVYSFESDGFHITVVTDVPCHLYCRWTSVPPRKHVLPSPRRGIYLQGDVRFCFVVYEDNEQILPGDTYVHTWIKPAWDPCTYRWCYFVGTQLGVPSVSETAIFKFHWPVAPPPPPPPVTVSFYAQANNRSIRSNWGTWPLCWVGMNLIVQTDYDGPFKVIISGYNEIASWWINRGFLTFDATSIPAGSTVLSANLHIFIERQYVPGIGVLNLCVTQGLQSDPVVTSDWGSQGPVTAIGGKANVVDFTIGQYNSIPLNAIGLALILFDQPTRLCTRQEYDITNTYPGHLATVQTWYHSYQKGLGYRPRLEVTYQPP